MFFSIAGSFGNSTKNAEKSGKEKTHKHKQICRIVPGLGGRQNLFMCFFWGAVTLWGRKTHKQNSPPNTGTIPWKLCWRVFFFMCFFRSVKKIPGPKFWNPEKISAVNKRGRPSRWPPERLPQNSRILRVPFHLSPWSKYDSKTPLFWRGLSGANSCGPFAPGRFCLLPKIENRDRGGQNVPNARGGNSPRKLPLEDLDFWPLNWRFSLLISVERGQFQGPLKGPLKVQNFHPPPSNFRRFDPPYPGLQEKMPYFSWKFHPGSLQQASILKTWEEAGSRKEKLLP